MVVKPNHLPNDLKLIPFVAPAPIAGSSEQWVLASSFTALYLALDPDVSSLTGHNYSGN